MKIVVAGPPHSGKSVFLGGLCACLPRSARYLFRACPDGEGTWTWRSPDAAAFRRKGRFTAEQVDWYVQVLLRASTMAPIVLIDIGGRTSDENRRILVEGKVDSAIILSGSLEAIPEWESFLASCGIPVLARIHSDYHGQADITDAPVMSVHHLERGEDVSARPVIQKVAEIILDRVDSARSKGGGAMATITISGLAAAIGKAEVDKTLPNGRVVRTVDWSGADLPAVCRELHNRSGEMPEVVDVDGAGPGWLYAALAHEAHPRAVRFNSPDGFVAVGCEKPSGDGRGENLDFKVESRSDGWTVVTVQQRDPSIPLTPEGIWRAAPPELPMRSKVVISGRLPHWASAAFAMAYHGRAKAVALFQPGVGATVVWTHSAEVALGSIV